MSPHLKGFIFVSLVLVVVGPSISPFSLGEVKEGDRIQVMCSIRRGDPPFTISWFKDNLFVGGDPEKSYRSKRSHKIRVTNPSKHVKRNKKMYRISDITYEDDASPFNDASSLKYFEKLPDLTANEFVMTSYKVSYKNMSDDLSRTKRRFARSFYPSAGRKQSSNSLFDDELSVRRIDEFTSLLVVTEAGAKHAGNYTCRGSNSVRGVSYTALLVVRGEQQCQGSVLHCPAGGER